MSNAANIPFLAGQVSSIQLMLIMAYRVKTIKTAALEKGRFSLQDQSHIFAE